LYKRQVTLDVEATARLPFLLARKQARMRRSAHAFFRGCSPLFYELLAARSERMPILAGAGYVVGDMHLENVGAYRGESGAVVFDLNDFDDATTGPWQADVLRLAVSTLLAARGLRRSGTDALRATEAMAAGWRAGVEGEAAPVLPRELARLVRRAEQRTDEQLFAGRAPETEGRRSFVRGERYVDLSPDLQVRVSALVDAYALALGTRARRTAQWRVGDAAWRVAGTGSLGVIRIAVVVSRSGHADRLIELKEARSSAVRGAFTASGPEPEDRAEAVVEAARALVADPPRHLAAISGPPSFVGRRLFPQEDKLSVDASVESMEEVARRVGWTVGRAHRRGARDAPATPWSDRDLSGILDEAVELAGLFESVYLAYCRSGAPRTEDASS
jgi:uncharacterized protein (DUF2252 family)